MELRTVAVAAVVVLAGPVGAVVAQECLETVSSSHYGVSNSVAAEGDRAVLANGAVVQILDLTVPSAPAVIGEVDLADDVGATAISGTTAFAVADDNLHVIDLQGSVPTVVGAVAGVGGGYGIDVVGDLVYVVSYRRFSIVDVSTPATPTLRGQILWDSGHPQDVGVYAGYAYIVDEQVGLRVVDVADPDAPEQVFALDLGSGVTPKRLDIAGGFAFVVGYESFAGRLLTVDLDEPAQPVLAANTAVGGSGDIVIRNDVASIAGGWWMDFYDVTNPLAPSHLGDLDFPDFPSPGDFGLAAIDDHVLATGQYVGLSIVDLSDPTAPSPVAAVAVPGRSWDVAHGADVLVIAADENGVRLVDVANPTEPVELGTTFVAQRAWGVAVDGNTVYVVGDLPGGGLVTLDITDPNAPVIGGSVPDAPGHWVAVGGDSAYVLQRFSGDVSVVDVSSPVVPVRVGSLALGSGGIDDWMWPVVIGDHLIVRDCSSSQNNRVLIIDVGDPTTPAHIATIELESAGYGPGLAVVGSWLLVSDYADADLGRMAPGSLVPAIRVFDMQDPGSPVEASPYFPVGDGVGAMGVAGSVAYVATRSALPSQSPSIEAVDFSDPTLPVFLGLAEQSDWVQRFAFGPDVGYALRTTTGFDTFSRCKTLLFADGFESGDTTAWSNVNP